MRVHRIVKARHALSPLDGEGARRVGGRWNSPGLPVVYCASSLSLAVLELLVHVDPADIPDDLVAIVAEIPDHLPVEQWLPRDLPGPWREEASKPVLQAMGGAWVKAATSAVILVPSVIVPSETNALINPAHPDTPKIMVIERSAFTLDPRLFHS